MRVMVISFVIDVLETIPMDSEMSQKKLEIRGRIETI